MEKSRTIEKIISYVTRAKTQELIKKYLRSIGFGFWPADILSTKKVSIREEDLHYSFMIRSTPTGRLDKRLAFGIKILGKKIPFLVIYRDGKFSSLHRIEWKEQSKMNFKKVKIKTKFPKEMTYTQRRVWRDEHAKVKLGKAEPSKFYSKWLPTIQFFES